MEPERKEVGGLPEPFDSISIVPETTEEGLALKAIGKGCNLILRGGCLISPFDGNVQSVPPGYCRLDVF